MKERYVLNNLNVGDVGCFYQSGSRHGQMFIVESIKMFNGKPMFDIRWQDGKVQFGESGDRHVKMLGKGKFVPSRIELES